MAEKEYCEICGAKENLRVFAVMVDGDAVRLCPACYEKESVRKVYEKIQPAVEVIFRELNGGDMQVIVEAFFQAMTHEHRYLQNEFVIMLWKFFQKYGSQDTNGYDARNEGAVRWAKKWYESV